VCSDGQLVHIPIVRAAHALEPCADRLHGELGRVAGDTDADETFRAPTS
jgi:hypothetical protein